MAKKIITIGDSAQKIGKTTVSGKGSGAVVKRSGSAQQGNPQKNTYTLTPYSGGNGTYTEADGAEQRRQLRESYEAAGDPLVAARDYVTGKGYSGVVNWDGESVTIGGIPVDAAYVVDGTAYIPRSAADSAVSQLEEKNGIIGNAGVNGLVESRYGSMLDDALDAVVNREGFSYEPEDDPVYGAYRDMYLREADDAFRRVLEENNSSVTGATGAVLSQALSSRNDYLGRLAGVIPTLAADAYDRYTDETDRLLSALESVGGAANSYYDRLYAQNRDAYGDMVSAGEAERAERQRWADNERNRINDQYDNSLDAVDIELRNKQLGSYDAMAEQELRRAVLENAVTEQEYANAAAEAAMDNAAARGFFVREDESALPWLARYRARNGLYSISPLDAALRLEYETQLARNRADYEAMLWGMY